jgi:bilin biosynthesis protein
VVKLFGWLKHAPAYDLIVEALHNTQPQFKKSRAAAAILMALAKLGDHSGAITVDETDWLVKAKADSIKN